MKLPEKADEILTNNTRSECMEHFSARQIQIIEASLQIISNKGIQFLTTKSLAEEIRMSEGGIYRHFKSKDDILNGIIDYVIHGVLNFFDSVINSEKTSIEKLKEIFLERCTRIGTHPEQIVSLSSFNYYKDGEKYRQQIKEFYQEYETKILQIIIKGQEDNEIPDVDPKYIYMVIIGVLNRFVMEWQRSDYEFDLYNEGEKLWNFLEGLINK